MSYNFEKQLSIGEAEEEKLDTFFGKHYEVKPVTPELQRLGADRIFESKQLGTRWLVEYKADYTAAKTGNAFIETVSVDTQHKTGWAYSSCSQILAYYIPPEHKVYLLSMAALKWAMPLWAEKYETRAVPNKNGSDEYHTWGLLVPLRELEAMSRSTLIITE